MKRHQYIFVINNLNLKKIKTEGIQHTPLLPAVTLVIMQHCSLFPKANATTMLKSF
jgi:hypothetical protein